MKFILPAVVVLGMISVTGCKKTTNNTTVVKDSVYYSPWIQLKTAMQVSSAGDTTYQQDITAKSITAAILSHGAVLGYYGYPYSASDTVMFSEAEMSASVYGAAMYIATGDIQIVSYGDLTYTGPAGYLFRYVVIPGNVLSTSFNGMTQQQLQKMSFTDIQKVMNTPAQTSSGNSYNP